MIQRRWCGRRFGIRVFATGMLLSFFAGAEEPREPPSAPNPFPVPNAEPAPTSVPIPAPGATPPQASAPASAPDALAGPAATPTTVTSPTNATQNKIEKFVETQYQNDTETRSLAL